MPRQIFNPLKFRCAPNYATPDYVTCDDFRDWLAYGLIECWLSHDPSDPNADCNFVRPWTHEDVDDLRTHFLDTVETVLVALWNGDHAPGDGDIEGDFQHVIVSSGSDADDCSNDVFVTWYVRLNDDAIMFELVCTGADSTCIWLSYDAIKNRLGVLSTILEAGATVSNYVAWDKLTEAAFQEEKEEVEV